jgi:hypothetical protein
MRRCHRQGRRMTAERSRNPSGELRTHRTARARAELPRSETGTLSTSSVMAEVVFRSAPNVDVAVQSSRLEAFGSINIS